ncbi:hypothetical protein Hanom_Chr05g00396151 [Helianthus anomalus]
MPQSYLTDDWMSSISATFLKPDWAGRDPETPTGRFGPLTRFSIDSEVGPGAGRSVRRVVT